MAATTKLIVYNDALREIAGQPLANLTTARTSLQELDGAFSHAVEYMLSKFDWTFARRRSTLVGVADTAFAPYTYRFTKPTDYLRKCWFKATASDAHQIDHVEPGAAIYAMVNGGLLEYISDDASNYDPANWPPHFTRCVVLYLAQLVAPKLARAGAGDIGMLDGKLQTALSHAEGFEVVFLTNSSISANRQPVFRRAIEFIGQSLAGSVAVHGHADKLRWQMNAGWDHAVKYVLELGAWNFATKRARLSSGVDADTVIPATDNSGMVEGYSYGSATSSTDSLPSMSGFDYAWAKPDDFLHKIWIKADPGNDFEVPHQFIGDYICTNSDPVVMEYVAENDDTTNPENWSANFLEAVAAYLALQVSPELMLDEGAKGKARITANELRGKLEQVWLVKLSDAKLRDAIQQYPKSIPPGSWSRSRLGGGTMRPR